MAGIMTHNSILIRRGDSFDIVMQFKNKNGAPLDISESKILLTVQDKDKILKFKIIGEIIDGVNGKARIKILPKHSGQEVGIYAANIEIIFKNGDVHTIFPQDLTSNAIFQISDEVSDDGN